MSGRSKIAAMIFKSLPQFGQGSGPISWTPNLSSRAKQRQRTAARREHLQLAGCPYRQEAAFSPSILDGKVCARATPLARMRASLSDSGSSFKHSVAPPVPKSGAGHTCQNNPFGAPRQQQCRSSASKKAQDAGRWI